ncbi:hypothetical protein D3C76_1562450 [compost metagenome]
MALVLGFQIPAFNSASDFLIERFTFQIIVDVFICHTQGNFIRKRRAIVFEIGGWGFLI